ncbi:MAG TPA: hypothetical protein VFT64_09710 [Rickettsiales bacterium]|nr:hypothetical protein [Rickettsiales bacterium]
MNPRFSCAVLRRLPFLALSLILLGCTTPVPPSYTAPEPPPVKQVKKPQHHIKPVVSPHYAMDAYIESLSLSDMELSYVSAENSALQSRLDIISRFLNEKRKQPALQPAIVVSYSVKDQKNILQLIAPFDMSRNEYDFSDLQAVLSHVKGPQYVIQDIHPVIAKSTQQRKILFSRDDTNATREMIRHELKALLANTTPLSDSAEAKVQLQLLRFFIGLHMRDAAYLAAENAEQSLASVEDRQGDNPETQKLSGELDTLKSRLRKEMPFTFKSL